MTATYTIPALNIRIIADGSYRKSEGPSECDFPIDINKVLTITTGTGDNQAQKVYYERRTVTIASPTDDLDLAGGLTDWFGNTLTFKNVKGLIILNLGVGDDDDQTPTDGQDLLVGGAGAASNAWGVPFDGDQDAKLRVRSGGWLPLPAPMDGYSVQAGEQDTLRIEHAGSGASGGDIVYDILVWGDE